MGVREPCLGHLAGAHCCWVTTRTSPGCTVSGWVGGGTVDCGLWMPGRWAQCQKQTLGVKILAIYPYSYTGLEHVKGDGMQMIG